MDAYTIRVGLAEPPPAPRVGDIRTDEDLCSVLDELVHGLGAGRPLSPLRNAFSAALRGFLREHRLDEDPDCFASLPTHPDAQDRRRS